LGVGVCIGICLIDYSARKKFSVKVIMALLSTWAIQIIC